jgi:hypothetical protein
MARPEWVLAGSGLHPVLAILGLPLAATVESATAKASESTPQVPAQSKRVALPEFSSTSDSESDAPCSRDHAGPAYLWAARAIGF